VWTGVQIGFTTTSNLTLTTAMSDNGASYECRATNAVNATRQPVTATATLSVLCTLHTVLLASHAA